MIKEFAMGLSRRHYFEDANNISQWYNLDNDCYMSLYDYDDEVKEYFAKNRTLSGFDGTIYIPEEFILKTISWPSPRHAKEGKNNAHMYKNWFPGLPKDMSRRARIT